MTLVEKTTRLGGDFNASTEALFIFNKAQKPSKMSAIKILKETINLRFLFTRMHNYDFDVREICNELGLLTLVSA